jgi:hypothetical protein
MLKRFLEALTGLALIRLGFALIGRHPLGGILTLIAVGLLILEEISQFL